MWLVAEACAATLGAWAMIGEYYGKTLDVGCRVGGDDQCSGCVYRTDAEKSAGIPYPNGY